MIGYRASGVPGTVRGLEYASKKFGKKPWAELVQPAVELASKGFALSYAQANGLKSAARGLSAVPGIQPHLPARRQVLRSRRRVRAGRSGPHAGAHRAASAPRISTKARRRRLLAKDMQEHGGLITLADLQALRGHRAQAADRQVSRLRHHHRAAAEFGRSRHSADARHAGRHGIRERRRRFGQRGALHDRGDAPLLRRPRACIWAIPDFVKVPLVSLLDPAVHQDARESIDPERATPSSKVESAWS